MFDVRRKKKPVAQERPEHIAGKKVLEWLEQHRSELNPSQVKALEWCIAELVTGGPVKQDETEEREKRMSRALQVYFELKNDNSLQEQLMNDMRQAQASGDVSKYLEEVSKVSEGYVHNVTSDLVKGSVDREERLQRAKNYGSIFKDGLENFFHAQVAGFGKSMYSIHLEDIKKFVFVILGKDKGNATFEAACEYNDVTDVKHYVHGGVISAVAAKNWNLVKEILNASNREFPELAKEVIASVMPYVSKQRNEKTAEKIDNVMISYGLIWDDRISSYVEM